MMRRQKLIALITTILVGFGSINAFSQDNDVPLVIAVNNHEKIFVELPVDCVDKPLKGYIIMGVRFDNDVSDTTKVIEADTAYLQLVGIPVTEGKYKYFNMSGSRTPLERCLWDACLGKPVEWMMKQPYSDYYNRGKQFDKGTHALSIGYPILFVPNKSEETDNQ